MKAVALLSLILFGMQLARATEVAVSYNSTNDLILTGPSCDKLLKQEEAICQWNQSTFKPHSCHQNQAGLFSLTVTNCLSPFIKNYQHKKNYRSGANCWGTAMNFKSISKKPRFIWSNEMLYWLDSPLCRKLAVGEAKEPGDLLNIFGAEHVFNKDDPRNRSYKFWEALFPGRNTSAPVDYGYSGYNSFLHTETYVTDELTFGKDSPSKDFRFEFHEMHEVYGRSRDPDCQENQTLSPYLREYQNPPKSIRGTKCGYFSLAYRCQDVENFFGEETLSQEDRELLVEVHQLESVQENLFPLLIVSGTNFSSEQITKWLELSDTKAQEALDELTHSSFEKPHEMLLVLKYFTASGIRKSLELATLTSPTEEL